MPGSLAKSVSAQFSRAAKAVARLKSTFAAALRPITLDERLREQSLRFDIALNNMIDAYAELVGRKVPARNRALAG